MVLSVRNRGTRQRSLCQTKIAGNAVMVVPLCFASSLLTEKTLHHSFSSVHTSGKLIPFRAFWILRPIILALAVSPSRADMLSQSTDLHRILSAALVCLIQCSVPALLILFTQRRSIVRYLWMLCTARIAYEAYYRLSLHSVTISVVLCIYLPLQAGNLLFVNSLDEAELVRKELFGSSASLFSRVWRVSRLVADARALNTRWQAKQTQYHPAFFSRHGRQMPSRVCFLFRQLVLIAWRRLLVDAIIGLPRRSASSRPPTPGAEFEYWNSSREEWARRILVALVFWFVMIRLAIDLFFRIISVIAVVLGASPADYPPTFGSMDDAYTLRNYWGYVITIQTLSSPIVHPIGVSLFILKFFLIYLLCFPRTTDSLNMNCYSKFWHQRLRWPFTAISKFLTQDVLKLPRPSLLERYTNSLFVFTISGLMHLLTDCIQGVAPKESGAMLFFPSFALGFMIEDGVQEIWRRQVGNRAGHPPAQSGSNNNNNNKDDSTPVWQKTVGYIWVTTFFVITSPWYMYPQQQVPRDPEGDFSTSVIEIIGIPAAFVGIVVGGGIVKLVLEGEV